MVEAAAVPILVKAVDFLFGQAREILKERRERREAEHKSDSGASVPPSDVPGSTAITVRREAINQHVQRAAVDRAQGEIEHLLTLLEIYTRNYRLAREQYAKWGSELVPAIVVNRLAEAEDQVATTTRELEKVLAVVYGRLVTASEATPETE